MRITHKDAESRYDAIRDMALKATQDDLQNQPEYRNLRLKVIDGEALRAARTWSESGTRRVDWDWFEGYGSFGFRYPKRFELAIWQNNELLSLTLGRPTYNGTAVRLDFIEAAPAKPKDIKVFGITLFAMIAYAALLGAEAIRVMHPINDAVKQYYASLGLIYVAKGDYLTLRL